MIYNQPSFDMLYFDGGTQGIYSPKAIDQILVILPRPMSQLPVEWTMEISPHTISVDKRQHWKVTGVAHISIDIQSSKEGTLRMLGRAQTFHHIFHANELVRSASFDMMATDPIFPLSNSFRSFNTVAICVQSLIHYIPMEDIVISRLEIFTSKCSVFCSKKYQDFKADRQDPSDRQILWSSDFADEQHLCLSLERAIERSDFTISSIPFNLRN
jgi:hypothetical protein